MYHSKLVGLAFISARTASSKPLPVLRAKFYGLVTHFGSKDVPQRVVSLSQEMAIENDLAHWLLEGDPWVVYRTLTWLLDSDENSTASRKARAAIQEHPLIKKTFAGLNKDGYWGVPKDIHTWWPAKGTTFWLLPVLADFGFTVEDRRIRKACEYVLSTGLNSGGFGWSPPTKPGDCHSAIIIEALAKLGLLEDPRVRRHCDWLVQRQRRDGGFWCKDTGQIGGPREKEPSCAFATMFVLGALAQFPRLRESEASERGVDFLLGCWENKGKMKYAGHDSQVGTDWHRLKYPFTDYKILKYLDVLSQFKHAKEWLQEGEIVELLRSKQDDKGRFTPESVHEFWHDFDFGQKGKPSRWLTLLALRIMKRLSE